MTRVRIALGFVTLAVLGLVGLLAWRAQQGLAVERAVGHEAVAERAFEEMEDALTRVLQREETRSFEEYAFYLPSTGARSPLAAGLEDFVVGAFQLDSQGAVTTPLEPRDPAAARARGDWPPDASVQAAIERVRGTVASLWSAEGADDAAAKQVAERDATREKPGTTRVVAGPGVDPAKRDAPALQKREMPDALDLLESLGQAADYRAERKQKVAEAPQEQVYGVEAEAAAAPEALADEALEEARQPALANRSGASGSLGYASSAQSAPSAAAVAPRSDAPAAPPSRRSRANVRIALDPMVGVHAGEETLVIYRTVLVDRRGYRQGLVLDRAALGAWLEERVLRASRLAEVANLHFDGAPPAPPSGHYVFAHRFAEPFDALEAHLVLAPLPGVGAPGALYALVAVLLAVGAAGLVAVVRTVSLTVQYAERRSNFVASVTHELKTPLTAIRMYAEMLRDGLVPGDAKRQEYYATITDESERLSRLVDNVLEFSKLEGGRRELAVVAGPIGPLLEEAAEKLASHAAREGFALEVDVEPGLPAVRFDRDAMLQVVFNLVDNAMKYARGAERKTVGLAARREGDAVCVEVRDFGPGVARPHLEHVFEPFYRGESELTRTTKGTGIGLALVRELAERMGAAVSGANVADGGFRVRVAFRPDRASA